MKCNNCNEEGILVYNNENYYCYQHYDLICQDILMKYKYLLVHATKDYNNLEKILQGKSLKPISQTNSKSLGGYENEKMFDSYKNKIFFNMIKPESFSPSEKNEENLIYLIFSPEIILDNINKVSGIHFCDNWFKGKYLKNNCLKYNKSKSSEKEFSKTLNDWNNLGNISVSNKSLNSKGLSSQKSYQHYNRFGYPENEVVFDFNDSKISILTSFLNFVSNPKYGLTTGTLFLEKSLNLKNLMYIYVNPKHKDFKHIEDIMLKYPQYNWVKDFKF